MACFATPEGVLAFANTLAHSRLPLKPA